MEPIEGSETSAFKTQTPGKYPKENILLEKFIMKICFPAVGSNAMAKARIFKVTRPLEP